MPDKGNAKTWLGSCVHEIFELISCPQKQERRKKYILHTIKNKQLHPVLDRIYSKFLIKYKIPGDHKDDLHEMGKSLIINAFIQGYDHDLKVIGTEINFKLLIAENNHFRVYINGFIDRVCEKNSEIAILTDYKTGRPFSENDCKNEYQPYFYKIAFKKNFPNYKYSIFNFHFLKNKKIITVPKTDEELEAFKNFIITQAKIMLNFSEKDASCNRTWLCNYCAFQKPNKELKYSGCPAFFDKDGNSLYKK
jgi:ATP-dependent exoDNAse (exonuclease V) beta subunit